MANDYVKTRRTDQMFPFAFTVWAIVTGTLYLTVLSPVVSATKYGAGSYGRCQYETCAISLSSSNRVSADVLPSSSGTKCTVSSDSVTVTTSSSTGYSLSLIDNDTSTGLVSNANSIGAAPGTYSNPAVLTANTWGYRVDNQGGFGSGPTSTVSSGPVPTIPFAGVQPSNGTAATLINSATAATNGSATSVWYGVCVGSDQVSGTYSDAVVYTALVN